MLIACLAASLTIASSSSLRAQANTDTAHLYLAIGPGLSIGATSQALHYSSYSAAIALEYGPVFDLDGASLRVSLESGYGQQIGPYERAGGETLILDHGYTPLIRRVPVMIWWTVESRSNISPFIRLGAGISWTQYTENYSDSSATTFDASDWGFTWGIGGGIRYRMSPKWSLALFLDDWVTTEDVAGQVETSMGTYSSGIRGPIKMTMIGLRGTMKIF